MIDVNVNGRKVVNAVQLVPIDTDYFKSWICDRLEMEPDDPGRLHLPEDATDDYCRQLVSEVRAVKPSGKVERVKIRDNHYFDAMVLNVALASMFNLSTLSERTRDSYRSEGGRTAIEDIANQLNG